jgi:hypothetical protein
MLKFAKITSLAVGIIALATISYPVNASESSGIGAKPANPREDNQRTSSIFVHEISPGNEVKDAITVTNNSDITKDVLVYSTDGQVASGGAFACEQKADQKDQEGTWVKLDKEKVTLARNSSETVGFTIKVPENASVGEHNSCIAIQAVEAPVASQVNGVNLSFRSAIRVAVTVPGDFDKQLSFQSLDIINKNSKTLIAKQVLRNSGNVSLDTNMITKLKTIFGLTLSKAEGQYPILPGQSSEFNFEINKPIFGGLYIVDASGTYNSDATSSLGENSEEKETVSKSKIIVLAPAPIISIFYVIILIILALGIYTLFNKNKQKKAIASKSISHVVEEDENIMSIAKTYDSDWKQTAKLNGLKSPYTLSVKQELKIVPGPNYVPAKTKSKTKEEKAKNKKTSKKTKLAKTSTKTKKSNSKAKKNSEKNKK